VVRATEPPLCCDELEQAQRMVEQMKPSRAGEVRDADREERS
jgi:hypothetical protein